MITARLLPLALIIGAIAVVFSYIQPTNDGQIATLKTEIKDLDTALAAARDFKGKELELTRQRAELPQNELTRLGAYLPDNVDNVQLIVDLNALGDRSGVALSGFNIIGDVEAQAVPDANSALSLETANPIDSILLTVSANGTYNAFRTFLAGLESSLRQLDVVELAVQDSDTGVYTYNLTLRLYWLR